MKKVLSLLLVLVMALTMSLTGCGDNKEGTAATKDLSDGKVKVGFIYIGPVNDGGWTQAHDNGRKYLEEQLGVKTAYLESIPEGPDSIKSIKSLIDQGCNVIFTTSFGYMEPTYEVAQEYPDVKFFHCSGYMTADNMSNYFGRMYEPRYLSGIVAGMKTKENKIGYVAAMSLAEVIRGINAFTLGVRSVNPDAEVVVKWSNTWIDQTREKEVAVALLDEGCDVITLHNDSPLPLQAAEERGGFAVGYNLDQREAAPKAFMTAPLWNWGAYYVDQVKQIIDGTWESSSYWEGLNAGIVELAELSDIAPADSKAKVDEIRKKIEDGSFKVFEGPIKDQDGVERVKAGEVMTDDELLSFDWFVEGVSGKIE